MLAHIPFQGQYILLGRVRIVFMGKIDYTVSAWIGKDCASG